MAQQPPYAPNVVNQTVDYGGVTWKGQPGGGWTAQSATGGGSVNGGGNTAAPIDPIETAKKLLEFQKTANQPVIQSLQGSVDPLKQRYNDVLASIKGNQQVAENNQTRITSNELGKRGLLPGDTYGQQEIQNSVLPVSAAFSGQTAQTGLAENQDLQAIAERIASLQGGNPDSAIGQALNITGQQTQANQFAQQFGLQQQQQAFAQNYITIPGVGVYDVGKGQIINQLNGAGGGGIQVINGVPYVNA